MLQVPLTSSNSSLSNAIKNKRSSNNESNNDRSSATAEAALPSKLDTFGLEDRSLELPCQTSLPVPIWFPHLITDTKSERNKHQQGAPVINQDLSIFARLGANYPRKPPGHPEGAHAGNDNTASELLEFWNWAELVDVNLNTLGDHSLRGLNNSGTLPFPEDRSVCALTHKLDNSKRVRPIPFYFFSRTCILCFYAHPRPFVP
jgi:hypothetical protein